MMFEKTFKKLGEVFAAAEDEVKDALKGKKDLKVTQVNRHIVIDREIESLTINGKILALAIADVAAATRIVDQRMDSFDLHGVRLSEETSNQIWEDMASIEYLIHRIKRELFIIMPRYSGIRKNL